MSNIKQALRPLASAAIFYYATLWLVVLVTVGTITQKYFGLQYSLEKYFSSWFIQPMEMPLVVPGGRFTMAIIMISLTAKLIIATKWKAKAAGINITHLGVLLLMIGGVITAYTTVEGNIAIKEGSSASSFQDFHAMEIAVTDRSPEDHDAVTTFTDGFFHSGQSFTDPAVPMTFKVIHHYKNCEPVERPVAERSDSLKERATQIKLKELPTDKEDRNLGGVEVEISGLDDKFNGTYIFLAHPNWESSKVTDKTGQTFEVGLRMQHHRLPFTIELKDFKKLDHAGTTMARAYSSDVKVTQGESSEDTKIYMNHPLRRDGFTLYQSSFDQSELKQTGIETSIFQVVYNKGQIVPYIAIVVITAGLLIHVIIQIPRLIVATKEKKTPTPAS